MVSSIQTVLPKLSAEDLPRGRCNLNYPAPFLDSRDSSLDSQGLRRLAGRSSCPSSEQFKFHEVVLLFRIGF